MERDGLKCIITLFYILSNGIHISFGQSITLEVLQDLKDSINALNQQLGGIQTQVDTVSGDVAFAQTQNSANAQTLGQLLTLATDQDAQISKLVTVNGIWQSNFRIISNTFARIKKRVLFTLPVLNLKPVQVTNRSLSKSSTTNKPKN